jgi:pimeloyl-ACP methyl ester carboxylesterase
VNQPNPHFFINSSISAERRIAFLPREGQSPTVVWLGGFRSDMRATKAEALDRWAEKAGHAFLRFDYSGHGESDGQFEDGTISDWLSDAVEIILAKAGPAPVLVGSSMGGWISLLAAQVLAETPSAPSALVLIAPAVDFTDKLMWASMNAENHREITENGKLMVPSAYGEPYAITRALIEDGTRHNLFGAPITPGCPVHILQGMQDPDVPWQHAMELVEHLPGDATTVTLIKDGDHRLSRPQDIDLLIATVERAVAR